MRSGHVREIAGCPPVDWRDFDGRALSPHELVRVYVGIVYEAVRKRMAFGRFSFEELFQQGCLGLVEAANRFDGRDGVHFTTYARLWVHEMIRRMELTEDRFRRSLREAGEEREPSWNGRRLEPMDVEVALPKLLEQLRDREREVIEAIFFEGRKASELAKEEGVSVKMIQRVKRVGLRRMLRFAIAQKIEVF